MGGLNIIIIILVVGWYNEGVDLDCGQGLLHSMPWKVLSGSLAWRSWFRTLYEKGIVSRREDDNLMFQIEIFA